MLSTWYILMMCLIQITKLKSKFVYTYVYIWISAGIELSQKQILRETRWVGNTDRRSCCRWPLGYPLCCFVLLIVRHFGYKKRLLQQRTLQFAFAFKLPNTRCRLARAPPPPPQQLTSNNFYATSTPNPPHVPNNLVKPFGRAIKYLHAGNDKHN